MPYGTVNADVIQTSTSGGILGAGNASIMKNRIINGAMVIDQRNAGASVATSGGTNIYTLDRWQALYSQTSKFTVQQNAGSVTPPAGFTKYLGVTSSSAYSVASGDYFSVNQAIEGFNTADLAFGTASASIVTLSFWVRSSLTGTFGGSLQNGNQDYCYPFTYTISVANTWEQKSVTVAAPTSGTWFTTNQGGLYLSFALGVGSTYSGTAGSWASGLKLSATGATSVVGTNGATFYITGVQLEKGSTATSFDYRPYGTELALCQRYAIGFPFGASQPTMAVGSTGLYSDANNVACGMNGVNLLNMRTVPTTVTTTGTQGTDWGFQTASGVNLTGFTLSTQNGLIVGSKTSHGITDNRLNLRVLTSSGNIVISSEL
jgi:hypothetical protein